MAGLGGSMAIIVAGRLAEALERYGADYVAGFQDYDDKLHAFVEEVQERAVRDGMATIFPRDEVVG